MIRKIPIVAVLTVIFFAILFLFIKNNVPTRPTKTNTTSIVQSSNNGGTVNLNIVKTSLGVGEGEGGGPLPTRITVPKTINVDIPREYQDKLEAYTSFEYNRIDPIVLAPKSWVGEGNMGANGNTSLVIRPKGADKNNSPYVSFYEIPACNACFYWSAGKYFSSVVEDSKKSLFSDITPIPEITRVVISPQLVSYNLPDTPEGYEVNGVAYAEMTNGHLFTPFRQIEVALPKSEHGTAKVILNDFIARYAKPEKKD